MKMVHSLHTLQLLLTDLATLDYVVRDISDEAIWGGGIKRSVPLHRAETTGAQQLKALAILQRVDQGK